LDTHPSPASHVPSTHPINSPAFELLRYYYKNKLVPYSITSIRLEVDPGFLAVSPHMTH